MRAALFITGAVVEFGGIMALAAPDFVPGLRRLAAWGLQSWQAATYRIGVWLRLRRRTQVVSADLGISWETALAVTPVKTPGAEWSLERKVEFLLGRDEEAQKAEHDLGVRVSAMETDSPRRLEELREQMQEHVAFQLKRAEAENRLARSLGAIALVIGLGLATAGNFVS